MAQQGVTLHAAQVEQAVLIMYGHAPTGTAVVTAEQQKQAIQWLVAFAESPDAWVVFPELLRSSHSSVQFYAVNGLYTLVCNGWTRLSQDRQQEVYEFLWASLSGSGTNLEFNTMRRLCLALAAATALSKPPNVATAFLLRALSQLGAALASSAPQQSGLALACLELLNCFPDTAADKPTSSDRTEAVRKEMLAQSEAVFDALQHVLASPASPFSVAASGGAPGPLSITGCATALQAAKEWLDLGSVTLGYLGRRYPLLLQAMLGGLLRVPALAVADAAGKALEGTLQIRTHPREPGRDDALSVIASHLISGVDVTSALISAKQWDRLRPIASLASALCVHEDEWVAQKAACELLPPDTDLRRFPYVAASLDPPSSSSSNANGSAVGGAPVGLSVLLGDLLLQLTSCGEPGIADVTVGCMMGIQSLPSESRHPFFRRVAFAHLLGAVLDASTYRMPRGAEDPDAFLAFRSSRSQAVDALIDCSAALRADFPGVAVQWLGRAMSAPAASPVPAALPGRSPGWLALESLLHCLSHGPVCDDLTQLLVEEEGEPSVEEAVTSLLMMVCAGPPVGAPEAYPEVLSSACGFIAALAGSPESDLATWLDDRAGGRPVRYATGHPFGSIIAGTSPSLTPTAGGAGDGQLDACFGTVHSTALVEHMLRTVLVCLQQRNSGAAITPMLRSAPRPDTMATIATLAGSTKRKPAARGDGDSDGADDGEGDDDASDDEDGEGARHDGHTGEASLPWRGAAALVQLCRPRSGRHFILRSPACLQALVSGVEASLAGGLQAEPSVRACEALLCVVTGEMEDLRKRDAMLGAAFSPLVERLGAAAGAAAATAGAGAGLKAGAAMPAELALSREVAIATTLLRSPYAADLPPASPPGHPSGGPALQPLDFLGDAVWRACEAALPPLAARPDVIGVLLQGLRSVVRSCPAVVAAPGRIPALLTLAVQLFQARLYPDALCVVSALVDGLPELVGVPRFGADNSPLMPHELHLPPDVTASCGMLLAAVSAAAATAAGTTGAPPPMSVHVRLADEPEALKEFFRLCQAALDVVPLALVGSAGTLATTLQLAGEAYRGCDRDTARVAADVIRSVLTRHALHAQPECAGTIDAALRSSNASLVRAIFSALFNDRGSPIAATVIETLRLMLDRYQGGELVEVTVAVLEEATAAAAASGAGGATDAGSDSETGLPCLSPADRRALITAAAAVASTAPHRFKMLMTDLGKIGRRQLTKDALLSYAL